MKFNFDVDMGRTIDLSIALLRQDGLKRGLSVGALYMKGQLMEYPQALPNATYIRTGNLRNRWTNKASNGGLTQTIGNNADYADDVQGSQRGSPYFRRIWGPRHSIRAVSSRESGRVGQIIQNEITRSI